MAVIRNPFAEEETGQDCLQPLMYIFDKKFNAAVDIKQRKAIFTLLNIARTKSEKQIEALKNLLSEEQYKIILKEYIYNYDYTTNKFSNSFGFVDNAAKIGNTINALYTIADNAYMFNQ